MSDLKKFEHLKIQLKAIHSATNIFSEDCRIGEGGFGQVYKGELFDSKGHTTVALKRLDRASSQGDREFWNEIFMLSLYKHENIVSLLGYCDDNGEKILVYKYAPKSGLDLHLKSNELTWVRRLKICIGAARGLSYLHSDVGTKQRVLHRDVKSSNILLDENWNAKIADFGLSKFGPANQQYSILFSNPVGTLGYCDPLYVETGILTKESDVYSFGVVLFEVLCGRLCIENFNKGPSFIGLVRKCYEKNNLDDIIFGNIKDEINPSSLGAFANIAYQCLKTDREERPTMNKIVKALETALEFQGNELLANQALDPPTGGLRSEQIGVGRNIAFGGTSGDGGMGLTTRGIGGTGSTGGGLGNMGGIGSTSGGLGGTGSTGGDRGGMGSIGVGLGGTGLAGGMGSTSRGLGGMGSTGGDYGGMGLVGGMRTTGGGYGGYGGYGGMGLAGGMGSTSGGYGGMGLAGGMGSTSGGLGAGLGGRGLAGGMRSTGGMGSTGGGLGAGLGGRGLAGGMGSTGQGYGGYGGMGSTGGGLGGTGLAGGLGSRLASGVGSRSTGGGFGGVGTTGGDFGNKDGGKGSK